ncbi:DNA double-strand break repair nuclease NurA [Halocatena salina]|uniref:DNA double-strand break repair nuclease NurA n=1 Tax=Halocatena salina TaxID=2934340 RepID=A0A8U0A5W9_9EURY|nr:DNA double-strand break repair nuclease NurA [Halocatena salina]UPM44249.1 DNA double-strand break repair nuclease NurA [Halocatena salina]
MDPRALSVVRDLFEHIDANVPREQDEQAEYARELFDHLGQPGGAIVPLGEPRYQKTRLRELGTWNEDPWPQPTYGLDASTTQPIEFNNGLIVDTAYAKLGVAGAESDRSIEAEGTIKTVVYFTDSDSTLHSTAVSDGNVDGEVIRFRLPDVGQLRDLSKAVATAAQHLAESEHLISNRTQIDGVCFIDGAVYPLGVVYWLLLEDSGRPTPAESSELPRRILRNYVDFIDAQVTANLPVVGVVKTSTIDEMLSALEEKIARNDLTDENGGRLDVPWTRDHQFMGEVLRDDSLDHLTYTSWFVQENLILENRAVDLLTSVDGELSHGDPRDYRRAFFYVRLPKTGDVLRVESPYLLVSDEDRRTAIRYKVLKEIAKTQDVPGAIDRADRIATITRENRETIRNMIRSSEASFDHNWDGRWSDIEESTKR